MVVALSAGREYDLEVQRRLLMREHILGIFVQNYGEARAGCLRNGARNISSY